MCFPSVEERINKRSSRNVGKAGEGFVNKRVLCRDWPEYKP